MASPHFRVLKQTEHLILRDQMSYSCTLMWKKLRGVGKEWDFVCLHECV